VVVVGEPDRRPWSRLLDWQCSSTLILERNNGESWLVRDSSPQFQPFDNQWRFTELPARSHHRRLLGSEPT
jgi:hypothetical protein